MNWRGGRWVTYRAVAMAPLCLLTACTVGEDYIIPDFKLDSQWNESAVVTPPTVAAASKEHWWEDFNDPTLNMLITLALANNNDLKITQERITEAQANERFEDSAFFPQVDATGSGKRGTAGGAFRNYVDTTTQGGVQGSWQMDLFGGTRRRSEAAGAGIEASMAENEQTRVRLIEEVARNYVRLRGLQKQQAITERNLKLQGQTLHVTQQQYKEKVVSRLDVLRAEAQSNRTKSRLPQIKSDMAVVLNRLAVLTDDKPRHLAQLLRDKAPLPAIPKQILASAPMDAMRQRPDVAAAERRLAQATALSGAAFAEFFPKLTVDGFFGRSYSNLFDYQSPWSASINGLLPLLNFGKIQSQVDAADSRQKQAYYEFRKAILSAIEEIEVALASYHNEIERQQTLVSVAGAQSEAVKVAREQYTNGIIPQLDLLDAQQNLLDADNSVVQSQEVAVENAITLYTALGYSTPPDKLAHTEAPGIVGGMWQSLDSLTQPSPATMQNSIQPTLSPL